MEKSASLAVESPPARATPIVLDLLADGSALGRCQKGQSDFQLAQSSTIH